MAGRPPLEVQVAPVPDDHVPRRLARWEELLIGYGLPDWAVTPEFKAMLEQAEDEATVLVLLQDRRAVLAHDDPSGMTSTLAVTDPSEDARDEAIAMLDEQGHAVLGVSEVKDEEDRRTGWQVLYGPK